MKMHYKYKRYGNKLSTPGYDFGPKGIRIVAEHGDYMVVRWGGYGYWEGGVQYQPSTTALIQLSQIEGEPCFDFIKEEEAGRYWLTAQREMVELMHQMGERKHG